MTDRKTCIVCHGSRTVESDEPYMMMASVPCPACTPTKPAADPTPTPPAPPADLVERMARVRFAAYEAAAERETAEHAVPWSHSTFDELHPTASKCFLEAETAVLSALSSGGVGEWLPSADEMLRRFVGNPKTEPHEGAWDRVLTLCASRLAPRLTALRAELDARTSMHAQVELQLSNVVRERDGLHGELAATRSKLDQVTGELNAAREAEVTSALTLKTMREQRDAALEEVGRLRTGLREELAAHESEALEQDRLAQAANVEDRAEFSTAADIHQEAAERLRTLLAEDGQ